MIVKNEAAYVWHLNVPGKEIPKDQGGGREQNEEFRILPGANVIPDDKAAQFLAHKEVQIRLKNRPPLLTIVVPPVKEGATREEGQSDLVTAAKEIISKSADEVVGFIATLADINLIREVQRVEDRPVVLAALASRINDLTGHRKDGK